MRLQACLNGARRPGTHPRLPLTPDDVARDAVAAVAAGADGLHVHVRGPDGAESLEPGDVAATLDAIRSAVTAPVGISTGAWVIPDPEARAATIAAWSVQPDFASVNLHEDGAFDVIRILLDQGVGIEAGLWNADSARALVVGGLAGACVRLLLEPVAPDLAGAETTIAGLLDALDGVAPDTPRLLHGFGDTTWPVLRRAVGLGFATRIGLEDTFVLPDGTPAPDNAALVAAGHAIVAGGPG